MVIWFPFCFLFVCLDVFSSYFACLKMSRDQNLRPCLCNKFFFQELFDHGDCWDWTTSVVQRAPSFGWLFEDGEDRLDRKRLSSAGPDGTLIERNVIQPDLTDLSADARVGIQPDLSEAHESDGTTCKYITYITHFNLHHTVDVRQKTGSRNLTSNLATSPETGQLGHPLQAYEMATKRCAKKEVWQKNWCNSGACNAVCVFFCKRYPFDAVFDSGQVMNAPTEAVRIGRKAGMDGMDGMDCMGRNEVEEVEGTNFFWRNKANESH